MVLLDGRGRSVSNAGAIKGETQSMASSKTNPMVPRWDVERTSGVCAQTGEPIQEGEAFYSVLFEEGDSFRRADYGLAAWDGPPEGAFCYYKTRMAVKEKRKKTFVDNEMLRAFFLKLAGETEPARVRFRFVIALILMRKRILRYEHAVTTDGVEVWHMRLTRDPTVHKVVNPRMSEDQIEEVSGQLSEILHADMGEWDIEDAAADGVDVEGTPDEA